MRHKNNFKSILSLLLGLGFLIIILSIINPSLINADWIIISNTFSGLLPYLIGFGLVILWVNKR